MVPGNVCGCVINRYLALLTLYSPKKLVSTALISLAVAQVLTLPLLNMLAQKILTCPHLSLNICYLHIHRHILSTELECIAWYLMFLRQTEKRRRTRWWSHQKITSKQTGMLSHSPNNTGIYSFSGIEAEYHSPFLAASWTPQLSSPPFLVGNGP